MLLHAVAPGAIVGIVIACAVIAMSLTAIVVVILLRRRSPAAHQTSEPVVAAVAYKPMA